MKGFLTKNYHFIVLLFVAVLVTLSFYAGFLEGKASGNESVMLSCNDEVLKTVTIPTAVLSGRSIDKTDLTASSTPIQENSEGAAKGTYVGSKNGTKYYLPNCATVKRIKPENYVWFQTEADAQLQGYSAGKC
jgi:hypothetical protein